jgi:transposase-like protein
MTQRKNHSGDFKAKVALEAVKSQKTINEIASQYEVHPNLVTGWKKQLLTEAGNLFSVKRENDQREQEELVARLYQQIGQLQVELEWVKKKLKNFS